MQRSEFKRNESTGVHPRSQKFIPVHRVFILDLPKLNDLALNSDYWAECLHFWEQIEDKFIDELTPKQYAWLEKIEERLNDY